MDITQIPITTIIDHKVTNMIIQCAKDIQFVNNLKDVDNPKPYTLYIAPLIDGFSIYVWCGEWIDIKDIKLLN